MQKTFKSLRFLLLALAIANEVIKLRTNLHKSRLPGSLILPDVEPDAETSEAFERAFARAQEAAGFQGEGPK